MEKEAYQKLRAETQTRFPHGGQSDALAFAVVAGVGALTASGIALSLAPHFWIWLLGQTLLGVAILQWLILVHDMGHGGFFRTKTLNEFFGHVASAFSLLPFYPWRYIHGAHHIWTGWKDLDPTMSQINPQDLSSFKRKLVRFFWRFWIPVFALAFALENFWNFPKIFRAWKDPGIRARCVWSCVYLALIVSCVLFYRPMLFLRVYGFAYLVFLGLSDPLLLSQHSHIPQKMAQGGKAIAIPLYDQDFFTRTLIFPNWASKWVFLYFDRHGAHHFFPNLPLYRLNEIKTPVRNEISWWSWLKAAKRIPVDQLLLESRDQTGQMI